MDKNTDTIDQGAATAEFFLQLALRNRVVPNERGPNKCIKCGTRNDRAPEGYGVCSMCMAEMEDEA